MSHAVRARIRRALAESVPPKGGLGHLPQRQGRCLHAEFGGIVVLAAAGWRGATDGRRRFLAYGSTAMNVRDPKQPAEGEPKEEK